MPEPQLGPCAFCDVVCLFTSMYIRVCIMITLYMYGHVPMSAQSPGRSVQLNAQPSLEQGHSALRLELTCLANTDSELVPAESGAWHKPPPCDTRAPSTCEHTMAFLRLSYEHMLAFLRQRDLQKGNMNIFFT